MAPLALVNEGVRDHFPILWLHWPSLMRGYQHTFWPYGGTYNEAPKRKNVALLTFQNAFLERFDSMGIPAHFTFVPCIYH